MYVERCIDADKTINGAFSALTRRRNFGIWPIQCNAGNNAIIQQRNMSVTEKVYT